jgi:magnesium transporter
MLKQNIQNNVVDFQQQITEYVENENYESAVNIIINQPMTEAVSILEGLEHSIREPLINLLDANFFKESISWLPDYIVREIVDIKGLDFIITLIQSIKNDDIPYIIVKDLEDEEQEQILDSMSLYHRKAIEKKLTYPKDSAGRLMQSTFIAVLKDWTVAQAIIYIKELEKSNKDAIPSRWHNIFIIDDMGMAIGSISMSSLVLADSKKNILDIKDENFKTIPTNLDQEEVALVFRDRGLVVAGVVNEEGILVGAINIDDVVDVIYKEVEEDFLLASGVEGQANSSYKKIFSISKTRLKWLCVNFAQAMVIPIIVSRFSHTLEKHIIISALISFVVGLGGNAGLQTVSVTIRGLALKLISKANAFAQIRKELSVALINGLVLGLAGCVWGLFWGDAHIIGLIAFLAVLINVMLGATLGSFVPLILKRLNIDPAVASSMFVTIFTDILGFFVVLLIATMLLN